MKHVLFIARAFPPAPVIAAVRCWNIAEQLRKHGWRLTVATVDDRYWKNVHDSERRHWREMIQSHGIDCIRTQHHLRSLPGAMHLAWYERPQWLARGWRKLSQFAGIESGRGWVPCLKKEIPREILQSVDVILADGSPFAAFIAARWFSRRYDKPYVIDFRDLWHRNPLRGRFSRPWELAAEKQCVRDAAAVIIVSPTWAEILQTIHKPPRKVRVISNGFSPRDFENLPEDNLGPAALVYAGSLYPPKITLDPILKALAVVFRKDHGTAIKLHLYGKIGDEVKSRAQDMGIESMVIDHGPVPRPKVLAALQSARMGIVVTSVYDDVKEVDRGIMTGKLFEVIGAGTPVLLIAPDSNDAARAIADKGIGRQFTGSQHLDIAEFLHAEMETPKQFETAEAERFSWDNIGNELHDLLRAITENDSYKTAGHG